MAIFCRINAFLFILFYFIFFCGGGGVFCGVIPKQWVSLSTVFIFSYLCRVKLVLLSLLLHILPFKTIATYLNFLYNILSCIWPKLSCLVYYIKLLFFIITIIFYMCCIYSKATQYLFTSSYTIQKYSIVTSGGKKSVYECVLQQTLYSVCGVKEGWVHLNKSRIRAQRKDDVVGITTRSLEKDEDENGIVKDI